MTRATIYDVAKAAGVSIATVSKVINGSGRISGGTRAKIMRIMEELDYQPSVVASALTGKMTYTLGLLLPDLANPFFAEIARSIEDHAHELGFSVMICSTDNSLDRAVRNISLFKQKRVDGIIIATGILDADLLGELRQTIPVALIARDIPSLSIDSVLVDDFIGGSLAANHLIEHGHRHIGLIAEDTSVMSSQERIRGYTAALEAAGIEGRPELVKVIGDFTQESARVAAGELLDRNPELTAFFACNDLLATAVIQAALERGLSIPQDLSVVGFDNTLLARIVNPPLNTIAQPTQQMGRQVVDLITRHIAEKSPGRQRIVMVPELVVRASVARPKGKNKEISRKGN